MSPDDYCRDKAAPPGSDLHYSLLSLPRDPARGLRALHALDRELTDTVQTALEPEVARAKLAWWNEELQRLFDGRPRHPVTQALAPYLSARGLPRSLFQDYLDGFGLELEYNAYPDFAALTRQGHRLGGTLITLGSRIAGGDPGRTASFAHHLGLSRFLLERLLGIRDLARRGRFPLPEDEMRDFGVRHNDLLASVSSDPVRALFRHQAQRIRDLHRRALDQLPADQRHAQRAYRVLARLELTRLDEIEAEGFRLLEQRTELTPLRKLWIAWRTARRRRREA